MSETLLWRLLYPLYIVWYVVRVSARSDLHHVHTTHAPQSLVAGFLLQLFGYVWVADIWDDPGLGNDLDGDRSVPRMAARAYNSSLIWIARRTLHRADLVVLALHPGILDGYSISPHASNVVHVTNGVDTSLLPDRQNSEEQLRVVYVGPIRWERGIGELLDAIEQLPSDVPNVRVELIGNPEASTVATVEEAKSRGAFHPHSVHVLGQLPHDDVLCQIASADIGVCLLSPSVQNYHYAYPIKIFEYLAGGTAIVCTRMYGTSEILTSDVDGLLVPPNDSAAVADGIARLARNEPLRRKLSERARETAKAYDWERTDSRIQGELSVL